MPRCHTTVALALALAVAIAGAGCSDDGDVADVAAEQSTSTTEPEEPTTTTATTTAPTTSTTSDVVELPVTVTLSLTGEAIVATSSEGSAGTAQATISYDGDILCASIIIDGTGPITDSYIASAPVDSIGGVVVDLDHMTGDGATDERCVPVGAGGRDIFDDPEFFYIVLETAAFPFGAVRAQFG